MSAKLRHRKPYVVSAKVDDDTRIELERLAALDGTTVSDLISTELERVTRRATSAAMLSPRIARSA